MARAKDGRFLLRIEDIDHARSRPEWEQQIYDDLDWLGIHWDAPPLRQSDRLPAYRAALQCLWETGLLYPCTCTRRDIAAAASAPQEGGAPLIGPDGVIYPGTCRAAPLPTDAHFPDNMDLREELAKDLRHLGDPASLAFTETGAMAARGPSSLSSTGPDLINDVGDIVLSRKDFLASYHLSVVLDDHAQSITHVVRGEDLFDATRIHVLLQRLLGLPTPAYHHHRLIRDDQGRRLAKRDDARAIATYRAAGITPDEIRAMVGL